MDRQRALGYGPSSMRQALGRRIADCRTRRAQGPGPTALMYGNARASRAKVGTCYAYAHGAGPAILMYGNTRASRAKVDKRYATKPHFV